MSILPAKNLKNGLAGFHSGKTQFSRFA